MVEFLNNQYGRVVDPVGVDLVAENKLCVYPNPVVETLYVRDVTPNTPVWIYTQTGSCIYQDVITSTSLMIDFSHYISGTYYLKVGSEGKVIIKR
ncbi:MAG: T9SS type A sorting domain-containing protein [Bacteroidales bacterium]|nr:T9SS type A sorting domain-containing protein [Bacteroidales bacterium]